MIERRTKLIETALPLAAINKASAREKSIRHGHPSTLHLWWARRPLAACRAVLFAQLVDDPSSDPRYRVGDKVDEEAAGIKRAELLNLIEDLVQWENSNNPRVLNAARAEIARCVASRKIETGELEKAAIIHGPDEGETHPAGPNPGKGVTAYEIVLRRCKPKVVNHFLATHGPEILDPFAGGGSIPLEAQRLGLRAYASDLNPVAVLINKALIEIPPRFAGKPPVHPKAVYKTAWTGAEGLAEDVRRYGQWMREEAEKRIGHLYPKVKVTQEMIDAGRDDLKPYLNQELTVIAWLWARTVESSDPVFAGTEVPLIKSFWLSKKKGNEAWLKPKIDKVAKNYTFRVQIGKPQGVDKEVVNKGTKLGRGCKFRCIMSNTTIPENHIKSAGKSNKLGSTLLAVVCEGIRSRVYITPSVKMVQASILAKPRDTTDLDAPLANDPRNLWCLGYGLDTFEKLFTPRQLTALTTFSDLVKEVREQVLLNTTREGGLQKNNGRLCDGGAGPQAYADSIAIYVAFVLSKSANYWSSLCAWATPTQKMISTFGRQALPMVWDFAEANPFSNSTGNFYSGINLTSKMVEKTPCLRPGKSQQNDATSESTYLGQVITTDPPYYDNIGYADLSDFFYLWLRRSLSGVYPDLLKTILAPKTEELIANPYRHNGSKIKAASFFEEGLSRAIGQWRNHGNSDYPTSIFYAFKQAETDKKGTASTGWETFLTGIIDNGFSITGTWPMRTELTGNLKKRVAALASSIVLSCVPRVKDAVVATRREFLQALKQELPESVRTLQSGSIAPVDLAQAAIGPGMAVFSRFAKVLESDGSSMTVRTALQLINQVLDEMLAEQEGDFDADTRWAVAWFEQFGVEDGAYGEAETLSRAKNTSVQGLVEAGVAASRGGKVRLVGRDDMPDDWDPAADGRLTGWEAVQHLIRKLNHEGEASAADLLRKLGEEHGERSRDLAYRLYSICERRGWAGEALAYNSLVIAWPEITRMSRQVPIKKEVQTTIS